MKQFTSILFFVLILTATLNAQSVKIHGPLSVSGTQLNDSSGNPVILRGMSYGWHNFWPRFYNAGSVKWLKDDWKCTVVRAAMGIEPSGGYLSDSTFAVDKIRAVVDAAIEEDIYVIIDWHSHSINLTEAKAFFIEMAKIYGGYPNVIYEIFNEPDDNQNWPDVKAYSIEVINAIRAIDPDNLIIVGSPHWDQDIHDVADSPIVGQTNIIYSVHFYAATHDKSLRDRADYAMSKGIPIFVSESAGMFANGDGVINYVEWDKWISWMEQNQISWINWSIADKDETCSVLYKTADSVGNWKTTDLKESGLSCRTLLRKYHYNYEPARIYKAMDKARRGEDLKIGVIGGSITAGYAASSESKRWSNLMANWWENKFPSSKIELINAGWGGTGSDIGVHRAYDDILSQNPDFIVIEFSVNDTEGEQATKMMEGLMQQIIMADSSLGAMILMLKQENGASAKESHKPVGEYYNIPLVNFADSIDNILAKDGKTIGDIYVDGVHPNDLGMEYIANMIKEQLDSIYLQLPSSENIPPVNKQLPVPLISTTYSNTYQYFTDNILPNSNVGWRIGASSWSTETPGSQIDFSIKANAISLVFSQNDDANRGRAEVWVDDGPKTIVDAYMNEDWGTRHAFTLVAEGLSNEQHILHIRSISESSTNGNLVQIERILVAGNIGSAPPIAKTSSVQKGVVDRELSFSGIESFDPDGESINSYKWSIEEKPQGSSAIISNPNDSVTSFVPDIAGEYLVNLIVSSGFNQSIPALKKVYVKTTNAIPVAVVGNDTMHATGRRLFQLDGSKSYDSDGDSLVYEWKLESSPEGSSTDIISKTDKMAYCKFTLEGDYNISLIVFDSIDYSEKSFIKVTAKDGYTRILNNSVDNNLFQVFPTPTLDLITVEYFLEKEHPVTIEMYSLNGTKLVSINQDSNVTGKNRTELQIRDLLLSPGTYLITLSDGENTYSKQMILL